MFVFYNIYQMYIDMFKYCSNFCLNMCKHVKKIYMASNMAVKQAIVGASPCLSV